MDIATTIRFLNIFLALVSIPPSLYILKVLVAERKIIDTAQDKLNTLLVFLFGGVVIGALLNAFISMLAVTGHNGHASELSIYRSIYTSAFFSLVTWGIYLFQKSVRRK